MIISHTLSFGDHNAGDPYRNMLCAIARSMGIVVGKEILSPEEIPWAGIPLQERYISTRPFIIKNIKMKQWNTRYNGFRRLIESLAQINNSTNSTIIVPERNPKTGKFVNSIKKPFVPFILFFLLTAVFCATTMPLFASVANPLRNMKYLHVKVVNYDTGSIGTTFNNFINIVAASSNEIPTFIHEPTTESTETYKNRVLDGEAWGVISINPDATTKLQAAVANGCAAASSYQPSSAITFAWDEGRNNIVAAPNIGGFVKSGVLARYQAFFASTFLANLPPSDVSGIYASVLLLSLISSLSCLFAFTTFLNFPCIITSLFFSFRLHFIWSRSFTYFTNYIY
jgi:hypothetical protein